MHSSGPLAQVPWFIFDLCTTPFDRLLILQSTVRFLNRILRVRASKNEAKIEISKMIIWEAIVDGASRMTPEEIPTVRHWAEAKVWLETGSKDQETTSNRTSEMKQNDKREKSSVQVLFISHIWPFQLNPLPTSRTDGAKEGEGRRQGKVSRRFKPYWIAYPHFCVRAAILIFNFTTQKNTQLSNSKHRYIILQIGCEWGLIWQSKGFKYIEWIM